MGKAKVQHEVRFGPFRTAHFREEVDAGFRRAFYSYLDRQIVPFLDGKIVRIDGRFHSHYDAPQFKGLAEVKHRYYYELTFHSAAGTEEAQGEVDYNPATKVWTPSRIKPIRITTLSEKLKEERSEELKREGPPETRRHYSVRPSKCPRCGSKRVARILYGLIRFTPGLEAEVKAGKTCLGGCLISDGDPQWRCGGCGYRWGLAWKIPLSEALERIRKEMRAARRRPN